MDIYDYLEMDHKKVDQLFKQFKKAPNKERQMEIIQFLGQELLVHAKSEEKTFYQTLSQHQRTKEQAVHGRKEHHEIEDKTKQLLTTKNKEHQLKKEVETLQDLVEHHVSDEEGKIFRKAKQVLSDEDALILKEMMHREKQKLLRQHLK